MARSNTLSLDPRNPQRHGQMNPQLIGSPRCEKRKRSCAAFAKDVTSIAIAAGSATLIDHFCPFKRNPSPLPKEQVMMEYCRRRTWNIFAHSHIVEWWKELIIMPMITRTGQQQASVKITILRIFEAIHIPPIVENPPPPLFLAACITFAFAVAAFRYSHRHDPFQDQFILTSVVVAIVLPWASDNFLMMVKSLIPWSVIFALILSSLAHRILGSFSKTKIDAGGGITEEMKAVWWREKSEGSNKNLAEISSTNEHRGPPSI